MTNNVNIRSLTKRQLLTLPGFTNLRNMTLRQLKQELNVKLTEFGLTRRGVKVHNYITAFNEKQTRDDNELFNKLSLKKNSEQQAKTRRQQYREHLKQTALEEREMMNIHARYHTQKSAERRYYEENVHNKKKFQREMKQMMNDAKHNIGFEVDIGDDAERIYAFTKVLRHLHSQFRPTDRVKPYIEVSDISGRTKRLTLRNSIDIERLVENFLGEIDVSQNYSDDPPEVVNEAFQADRIVLQFINHTHERNHNTFHGRMRNPENNRVYEQEFEITDDFRNRPDGSFFPYINTTNINLEVLQIFNTVDKKNYRDSCFIYACIQSQVFTEEEIQHMRSIMQTRSLSNDKIITIAQEFKCNFVIRRIDENKSVNHQMVINIDTRKTAYSSICRGWPNVPCIRKEL